ncbi:MAG TPA: response regulator [Planctomycetota bacterium]|nr:response regulator [Planctomycetota bacterium]
MGTRIRERQGAEGREETKQPDRRILVVDDDATIRNILVQILKLQGYQVEAACNGAEALDRCSPGVQPFDVLITDLMMPLMGGKELIERVRGQHPDIRVICLSATYSDTWLDLSVLFVPKPFSLRGIVALVKSALEGTRWRKAQTA